MAVLVTPLPSCLEGTHEAVGIVLELGDLVK
jgi:hypothetical protein